MATANETRNRGKALEHRSAADRLSPWDDMERWFGDFGRHGWPRPFKWEWPQQMETVAPFEGKLPNVDLLDRENDVVVRAELPGVKKGDVEVTVEEYSVTIKASTRHEEKEEKGEYYRREMSSGEYQRTLALPSAVDEEKAQATFTDGVLELTLPKLEKTRRKTVKVE